jgi:hypothetical protein
LEDQVRRIDSDYGFNLSDEEIPAIACRAEEFARVFRCLYEVDRTDKTALLSAYSARPE